MLAGSVLAMHQSSYKTRKRKKRVGVFLFGEVINQIPENNRTDICFL